MGREDIEVKGYISELKILPPPLTHNLNLLWFRVFYCGVLDLTLNKLLMKLQGLCMGEEELIASKNEDEAGFIDLRLYSTVEIYTKSLNYLSHIMILV